MLDGYFGKTVSGEYVQIRQRLVIILTQVGFQLLEEDTTQGQAMEDGRTGPAMESTSDLTNYLSRYLSEEEADWHKSQTKRKQTPSTTSSLLTFHYPALSQIFSPHHSFEVGVFVQRDGELWKVWATDPLTLIQQEDGPLVEKLAHIASQRLEEAVAKL